MGGEHTATDGPHCPELASSALIGVGIEDAAAGAARGDDDGNPKIDRAPNGGKGGDGDIAATEGFDDKAASAVVDGVIDEAAIGTGVYLDDIDPFFDRLSRDVQAIAAPACNDEAVLVDKAERAEVGALESIGRFGMGLGGFGGSEDLVGKDDERAEIASGRVSGDADGGAEVGRAIPAQFGAVAHGSDEHDRFIRIDEEVKKESGLFKGISAVGDDGSFYSLIGQLRTDEAGEIEHPWRSDVGAGPAGKVRQVEFGEIREPGDKREDLLSRKGGDGAASQRIDAHRNGSAGKDQGDSWLHIISHLISHLAPPLARQLAGGGQEATIMVSAR